MSKQEDVFSTNDYFHPAEDWWCCPVCLEKGAAYGVLLRDQLNAAYGVSSREEYERLSDWTENELAVDRSEEHTVRAFYSVHMNGKTLVVRVEAKCKVCGYKIDTEFYNSQEV